MKEKLFNWLTNGQITISIPKKRYWHVDLSGNEYRVSGFEYYTLKFIAYSFLITMFLAILSVILISLKYA